MHLHHLQRAPLITRTRHARACSTCNIPASHNAPTHPTAHDDACVTQRDFHIHAYMHTYARANAFSAKKFLPIRIFHPSTTTKLAHPIHPLPQKKTDLCVTHRSVQMKSHSLHKSIVRHCADILRIAFPNALLISFQYIHYSGFLDTYNLTIITCHLTL